jgi:hypothetical protein
MCRFVRLPPRQEDKANAEAFVFGLRRKSTFFLLALLSDIMGAFKGEAEPDICAPLFIKIK